MYFAGVSHVRVSFPHFALRCFYVLRCWLPISLLYPFLPSSFPPFARPFFLCRCHAFGRQLEKLGMFSLKRSKQPACEKTLRGTTLQSCGAHTPLHPHDTHVHICTHVHTRVCVCARTRASQAHQARTCLWMASRATVSLTSAPWCKIRAWIPEWKCSPLI